MRQIGVKILIAVVAGLICPVILFAMAERKGSGEQLLLEPTTPSASETTLVTETQTPTTQDEEKDWIQVLFPDGAIQQLELENYITSVVLREMPAEFETQALMAQAVVARTYTLRHQQIGTKHAGADVCTDSSCCQGYWDKSQYLQDGGTRDAVTKVEEAVLATKGQVLVYEGKLIEATYFSCSGGMTEDASAVWGSDLPYLQSVSSPGEEEATYYTDTVKLTAQEFQNKLQTQLQGVPESWIGKVNYTEGGGVASIVIGGKEYSGVNLRQLLGLRSTAFVITALGNSVTITTKGYGHRVGMSQYGADAMAVAGNTYAQILAHYYQNTSVVHYRDMD